MEPRNEYNPDFVTSPHITLLETMEAKRLTSGGMVVLMMPLEPEQTEALLRGGVVITQEIAAQLEAILDVPARFWLNRQRRFGEINTKRCNIILDEESEGNE